LLLINNGTAISRALFIALPYEPEKDFAMISTVGFFPLVIVADPKSPLKTVKDVIAAARAKPGRMNIATIGIGSTQHLAAELFKSSAGVDVQIVPYKATGEVVTAAKNGDADLVFEILAPAIPHIRSGNLRAIAVTPAKRLPAPADAPTDPGRGVPGEHAAAR